jgi:excisionase family DNA binding protein
MSATQPKFRAIESAARELGLPVSFLRREVQAARLPAIKCGRRWLVNPADIEAALCKRAAEGASNV